MGNCLGIRVNKEGSKQRLSYSSNLVSVDSSPFGAPATPKRPANLISRNKTNVNPRHLSAVPYQYQPQTPNGVQASAGQMQPTNKLFRQTSSLSNQHQSPTSSVLQQHNGGPKLVEFDENPSSPFEKNLLNNNNNSQLNNCNMRSSSKQATCNNQQNQGSSSIENTFRVNPGEIKLLIALYDYENLATKEDLAFCKGEHLETAARYMMESDWWLARSKTTKKVGWVPSNYVAELKSLGAEPWYLGKIGRNAAETQLKMQENQDGAFMIRDSETTTTHRYSLSVLHLGQIKHYRIQQFEAGGYYINKKTVFSTIHDLVLHYSNIPDGLCINLRKPCSTIRPMPNGLSYETQDAWEVDRNKLTLLQELGRGQFGQVYEGIFHGENGTKKVAIKTLRKGSMDPRDFLAEAQIMKRMRHENLVQLFAVCTREEPVYIVTELMSKGALISYLQTEEGKNLKLPSYVNMATQIAAGMTYLEKEKYVHRDLAARNILVGENNKCKIADFGLARFINETEYEARVGAKFPIKWTAPEAATHSKFTIKSDVWSFGIVLYEIITKGGAPYPDKSNHAVLDQIEKGYRMGQPPGCEDKYYNIMKECWRKDPNSRPTFESLHWRLSEYFTSDEQYREASLFRNG